MCELLSTIVQGTQNDKCIRNHFVDQKLMKAEDNSSFFSKCALVSARGPPPRPLSCCTHDRRPNARMLRSRPISHLVSFFNLLSAPFRSPRESFGFMRPIRHATTSISISSMVSCFFRVLPCQRLHPPRAGNGAVPSTTADALSVLAAVGFMLSDPVA